jgi:hypothetical protein
VKDRLVQSFTRPDGRERVLIVQRPDGAYSYRRQWRSSAIQDHPDSPILGPSDVTPEGWAPIGPYCGIYDTQETAEHQAFWAVPWFAAQSPH